MKIAHFFKAAIFGFCFKRFMLSALLLGAGSVALAQDLTVLSIENGDATTNTQSLAVTGMLEVEVANIGASPTLSSFVTTAFEDRNANGLLDAGDLILGQSLVESVLESGATTPVSIPLAGTVSFAGNLIYVVADSGNALSETNETNNTAHTGLNSQYQPAPGPLDPVLEWSWTSSTEAPNSLNVMMTPAVIDLNGDGFPEVIFGSSSSTSGTAVVAGILRAIDGRNGSELFSIIDPELRINTAMSIAVGDIDIDGKPEIIASDDSCTSLLAFNHDGTLLWRSEATACTNWGAVTIADLNRDGVPEILHGRDAFDNQGRRLWRGTGGVGSPNTGGMSLVADVDLDGQNEVVAGQTVYNTTGGIKYTLSGVSDGYTAVGNFDADDFAEIVHVSGGRVRLFNHNGSLVWGPVVLPGGGAGGPPTIADFDNDGEPEIGVAGSRRYVVFDTDGSVLWQAVTEDTSSNRTGSSVFDFDGDGSAEVVYRDERNLRVYRGTDGAVLFQTLMSSCTWAEYVLVADVDADGKSEIVATANNNCGFGPLRGVFVYGGRNDNWVATRPIWNQHTYHVTNINSDGSIPAIEQNNWLVEGLNNYRLNQFLPGEGSDTDAPDLTVSFIRFDQANCPQSVGITARIGNGGSLIAPAGVRTSFYHGDPNAGGSLIGTVSSTLALRPGQFQDVTLAWTNPVSGAADIHVVVDRDENGASAINEGNEANNSASASESFCAPSCLNDLAARAKSGQVQLTWTHVPGASYGVQRSAALSGPYAEIAQTDSTYSTYLDTAVTNGQTYYYQIRRTPGNFSDAFCLSNVIAGQAPAGRTRSSVVPNLVGMSEIEVVATLSSVNLRTGIVTQAHSNDVPAGMVFAQDPPQNSFLSQNSVINYTVSLGAGSVNTAPVITLGDAATIGEGATLLRSGSFSDPDTDTWSATIDYGDGTPVAPLFLTPAGTFDLEHTYAESGQYTVTVSVNDGSEIASASFTLTVQNLPPLVNAGTDRSAAPGTLIALAPATFADPGVLDTHSAVVDWGDGSAPQTAIVSETDGSGSVAASHQYGSVGSFTVTVTVTDDEGATGTDSFVITIQSGNQLPSITSSPLLSARAGMPYQYDVEASDADSGDTLTFSLITAPAGMSIDPATGAITWTPNATQVGGQAVTVQVADGNEGVDSQTFTVTVAAPNSAPEFTSSPATTATVGSAYQYDADASDEDGDTLSFSLDAAPAGMTVNPVSGLIGWTPTAAQTGAQAVTLRVEDAQGGSVTQNFTIDVSAANTAPVIVSVPVFTGIALHSYHYDVEATDAENDTLTYSLTSAPSGMNIVPATGVITWTPTGAQVGMHNVTVEVADGRGGSVSQGFSVGVSANSLPIFVSAPILVARVGAPYTYQIQVTEADSDSVSYALDSAPTGMTINAQSGLVSWTPAEAQPGAHNVVIRATDSVGDTATQSFAINVSAANTAPVIISTPVTSGSTGTPYRYDVNATDAENDTLHYSLTQAPLGMAIDTGTGVISWMPQISQVGSHGVNVRVTDGTTPVDQAFTIQVAGEELPLDVSIQVSPQVIDAGESTTVTVTGKGGSGPVVLSLRLDGVPVSLDASGQVVLGGDATGTHFLEAFAEDGSETVDASAFFTVRDPDDVAAPVASITSPTPDARVTAPVDIIGTAGDENLARYSLRISPSGQNDFTEIDSGTAPVTDGVLGRFDPTLLENGTYDLMLVVTDVNGEETSATTRYRVTGDMKIGNFSFSVEDLSIPVAGIPITVNRTYDTRQSLSNQDFGYGWRVDYQNIKIEENVLPAQGWYDINIGSLFSPRWCITTDIPHLVTVTLPDGDVEEFFMSVTPECATFLAPSVVQATYTPLNANTTSTLQAVNPNALFLAPSNRLEQNLQLFNPSQYILTTPEGYAYRLEQGVGILSVTDPNGNTLTYGQNGIVHSSGKSIAFTRDDQGRITVITDPNGNTIRYAYNSNGDLVSVTNQQGEVTRHTYNRSHGLVEYIDPRGNRPARNFYDDAGRLIATEDANGNRIELGHDVEGRRETVRDRLGNVTVFEYDERGYVTFETNSLSQVTGYTHDTRGNELTKTDPLGGVITKTFDARDNVLTETDPLGHTIIRTYNARNQVLTETDQNGNVTTNTYDTLGNPLTTTDALGQIRRYVVDGDGNITSATDEGGFVSTFTYDVNGNRTSETDALGNVTTFAYDANGNEISETQTRRVNGTPVSVTTSTAYDASNRVIAQTDARGFTTRTEYNAIGEIAAEIDASGNRTEYEYDARGHRVLTRYPDGTITTSAYDVEGNEIAETDEAGRTTRYEYDALKRLVRTIYPDGSQISNGYDAKGRLVSVTDERGSTTTYGYDAADRRTGVTDALGNVTSYTYDANGNQVSMTDANGRTTEFEYDALDRLVRTVYPNGTTSTIAYDALGRKIAETDQAGVTTAYAYDALDRLIRVTDALGGATGYSYDELGNKLTQTDAAGRVTRWTYDNEGNVLSRTLPLGQVETFTYDANGNQLSHTDFNGDTTTFAYDEMDRLALKTFADGTAVAYSYTPTGNIASETDASGTVSYTYDSLDRLAQVTQADGSVIEYGYDAAGNRTSLTTPSGTTAYAFDALNRLIRVIDPSGGQTNYTYDAVGNQLTVTQPNGAVASHTYDTLDRLTALVNRSADSSVISSYHYTLGATGNRLRVVEHDGRAVDYSYDMLYRLTVETVTDALNGDSETGYTFDAVGNRLAKIVDGVVTNYTYDANDRLLDDGEATYSYDANGNQLSKDNGSNPVSLVYDFENRLVEASNSAHTSQYEYDADGTRRAATVNGIETRYVVDKNRAYAQVVEELDGAGDSQVIYIYGDDLLSQSRDGEDSYYHYDGLGSARALSDSASAVTDAYTYDGGGNLIRSTGDTDNDYRFAGEQLDQETGLYYLRARHMDTGSGRFVSMDSFAGFETAPLSLHKYLYGEGDAVNNIDPSGNIAVSLARGALRGIKFPKGAIKVSPKSFKAFNKSIAPTRSIFKRKGLLNKKISYKEKNSALSRKLPGPKLPDKVSSTFKKGKYKNRQLEKDENFYKYHGRDNRTGKKYSWVSNKKYSSEAEMRVDLAIRRDWGVNISKVSTFRVPKGTWVSEGSAAAQGGVYSGGGYQAVIGNLARSWAVKTVRAF